VKRVGDARQLIPPASWKADSRRRARAFCQRPFRCGGQASSGVV
jgi:hypothetical protein